MKKDWYGGVFDENRDSKNILDSKIAKDKKAILVAVENNDIVGTISIIEDGRVAWLYRFVCEPNDQKVAEVLYNEAMLELKNRGHREVLVYSEPDNQNLQNRYNNLGFNKGGNYDCYWKEL
jgi:predicted N-acetyltransferase YhbS